MRSSRQLLGLRMGAQPYDISMLLVSSHWTHLTVKTLHHYKEDL